MKKLEFTHRSLVHVQREQLLIKVGAIISLLLFVFSGCNKLREEFPLPPSSQHANFKQTNLVSDTAGFNAVRIDTSLVNAWGVAINQTGIFWISANNAGLSVVYDQDGNTKRPPVAVPFQGMLHGGNPTGVVFNGTSDFVIPTNGLPARFIFATENGTITAWNSGDSTVTIVDRSMTGAVYKGLTLAGDSMKNFLFATDFHNAKIDVFDKNFMPVTTMSFMDPDIPIGFAPFNIRLIEDKLYVTYAKQLAPDNHDDQAGPGNGFVDIFDLNGNLIKRFASNGLLNSPWGITEAPKGFGLGKEAILVGNFGDGRINIFSETGVFQGQLKSMGSPVTIDGLWTITFKSGDAAKLFFTAGPDGESHGLFGFLKKW